MITYTSKYQLQYSIPLCAFCHNAALTTMFAMSDLHCQPATPADVGLRMRPVAPIERCIPQPTRMQQPNRLFGNVRSAPPLRSSLHFPLAALDTSAVQLAAAAQDEGPGKIEMVIVREQLAAPAEADAKSQVHHQAQAPAPSHIGTHPASLLLQSGRPRRNYWLRAILRHQRPVSTGLCTHLLFQAATAHWGLPALWHSPMSIPLREG